VPEIGPDTRAENVERLQREAFDVCVIGGGITGAGIALDAASRGLSVALVERDDFASGTSSKSSKLIHGGLRYLAQYDFALTWEGVRERDVLRRLAPHLVRPLQFLYPITRKGRETRFATLGLTAYDVVAGMNGFRRHHRAKAKTMRELAPRLDQSRVAAAWTYWDAFADDARLVFAVVRAAHSFGAVVANYVEAAGLDKLNGQIRAVVATDTRSGRSFAVRARQVVNAAGVWAERVGSLDAEEAVPGLRPAKGIHIVIPSSALRLGAACIFPSAAHDRRSLFAIPWGPVVILGTTDTEYGGALDSPAIEEDDVEYVLASANRAFELDLTSLDVAAGWAGLRPLRAGDASRTADLSRRHAIELSSAGLITITGGKLTTYRRMAADAVDLVCRELGVRVSSRTAQIPLGITRPPAELVTEVRRTTDALRLDPSAASTLVGRYGDLAPAVAETITRDRSLAERVSPEDPTLYADIAWAYRAEMAARLEDALARRTRLALRTRDAGLADLDALARATGVPPATLSEDATTYAMRLRIERGPLSAPATVR
jgi:glycerol-3-phosphate dehydrogenase